jgi:hypothetical protein
MNIVYNIKTDTESVISIAQGSALWEYGVFIQQALKGRKRMDYALSGLPIRACIIRRVLPYAIDYRAFSPF